jgi:hypothetical protein
VDRRIKTRKSKQLTLFELCRVATKATTRRDTTTLPAVGVEKIVVILFGILHCTVLSVVVCEVDADGGQRWSIGKTYSFTKIFRPKVK